MKFFAYGVEVIDVVVRALGYSHCGPGSIRGLDAVLWWGFFGFILRIEVRFPVTLDSALHQNTIFDSCD